MRVVINKTDEIIGVDGIFVSVDLSTLDLSIRVIQWYDTYGHIEFYDFHTEDIDNFDDYKHLIELHSKALATQAEEQIIANKPSEEHQKYLNIVSEIESNFNESNIDKVEKIINELKIGLTLGKRIRDIDNVVIGVNIDYLRGESKDIGIKGLLNVRKLFKEAKELQVMVFADLMPKGIGKEQLSLFVENLGANVIRNSHANYMYLGVING